MTIKRILVPLDGRKESNEVLDTALIVANRFGSHIDALHVKAPAASCIPFTFDTFSKKLKDSVIAETSEEISRQAEAIHEYFTAFCQQNNVEVTDKPSDGDTVTAAWNEENGEVSDLLVQRGRLADVITIARPGLKELTIRRSPIGEHLEAVLLRCGRPVLVVPPNWKAKKVEHAAIGWNESLEASRALAMTMPWLPQMSAVTVIVSKKRQPRVNRLIDYLAWHGVNAEVQLLDGKGDSVGTAMLNICDQVDAEFLIVGGFSRARARQLLFGGVTRHLLEHSRVITVMVH